MTAPMPRRHRALVALNGIAATVVLVAASLAGLGTPTVVNGLELLAVAAAVDLLWVAVRLAADDDARAARR